MGGNSAGRGARISTGGLAPEDHVDDVLNVRKTIGVFTEQYELKKQRSACIDRRDVDNACHGDDAGGERGGL